MTERVCQTCGTVLVNPKGRRKFCSDRCRKAQYDLACVDCGGRVDGTTPGKMAHPDEPRCMGCFNRYVIASGNRMDMRRARAKRERLQELYLTGEPLISIAARLGVSMGHLSAELDRMRKGGYDLPYRYKAYERKKAA